MWPHHDVSLIFSVGRRKVSRILSESDFIHHKVVDDDRNIFMHMEKVPG